MGGFMGQACSVGLSDLIWKMCGRILTLKEQYSINNDNNTCNDRRYLSQTQ